MEKKISNPRGLNFIWCSLDTWEEKKDFLFQPIYSTSLHTDTLNCYSSAQRQRHSTLNKLKNIVKYISFIEGGKPHQYGESRPAEKQGRWLHADRQAATGIHHGWFKTCYLNATPPWLQEPSEPPNSSISPTSSQWHEGPHVNELRNLGCPSSPLLWSPKLCCVSASAPLEL